MPPPNMPIWHKDYFELKTSETQQVHKEAFLELPLSEPKQKLLRSKGCHASFSWGVYGHKEDGKLVPRWTCPDEPC